MKVIDVPVKDIKVKYRFRQPSDQKVDGLVESIKQCGLIHPINIDSSNYLISGYHRLLAHQKLNQEHIPCIVRNGDKRMSDLIQCDENLMVNSLSVGRMATSSEVPAWSNVSISIPGYLVPG